MSLVGTDSGVLEKALDTESLESGSKFSSF